VKDAGSKRFNDSSKIGQQTGTRYVLKPDDEVRPIDIGAACIQGVDLSRRLNGARGAQRVLDFDKAPTLVREMKLRRKEVRLLCRNLTKLVFCVSHLNIQWGSNINI
jgi:hypothetical protein